MRGSMQGVVKFVTRVISPLQKALVSTTPSLLFKRNMNANYLTQPLVSLEAKASILEPLEV